MTSKAMKVATKKRLGKTKVQLARFKVKARKEMARMAATLKRHERAVKLAAKRYKSAMK